MDRSRRSKLRRLVISDGTARALPKFPSPGPIKLNLTVPSRRYTPMACVTTRLFFTLSVVSCNMGFGCQSADFDRRRYDDVSDGGDRMKVLLAMRCRLLAIMLCIAFGSRMATAEDIAIANYGVAMNGMPFAIAISKGYFKEEGAANIAGIMADS